MKPLSCVGAGCEAEAVRIISNFPNWNPGIQDGKPVRLIYSLPIDFNVNRTSFKLSELKKSSHNYILLIDGKEYTLQDCETNGFKKFQSDRVVASYLHPNQELFAGSKQETYVIELKNEYKELLLK